MDANAVNDPFQIGNRCLLFMLQKRYMVAILDITDETVRVSFPVSSFPCDGMLVTLEFHDESGYSRYETEIVAAPREVGDGLLLKRPAVSPRRAHRSFWRVPVDFSASVKGQVHPRRYTVQAVNLSVGGMLIRGAFSLSPGDLVDVTFAIPGNDPEKLTAEVVHCAPAGADFPDQFAAGLRFVSPDPATMHIIGQYVWQQARIGQQKNS